MTATGRIRLAITALTRGGHNYTAYGLLLQHCTDHLLFLQAKQLHARLVLQSITPDNYLASKLIPIYAKQGRLDSARHLFDRIPHKTLFSFNVMLIAYSHHSLPSHCLSFFPSIPHPDAVSVSALLKSLSSSPSCLPALLSRAVRSVHGYVVRGGMEDDVFVGNGLITAYARLGDALHARTVFDHMPEKDVVSWNSMISGYSQSGFFEECLELYHRMDDEIVDRLGPNKVTVVSVLHACAQLGDLDAGKEVHKMVVEKRITMDGRVWNSLIGFYAKCGSLEYAIELFEETPIKDEVTYGAMISGYMSCGNVGEAKQLFQQMEKPVLSTWNAVISGLSQNACHADVPIILDEMQVSGVKPNSVTLSCVLTTLSFFSNLLGTKQVHSYALRNDCDQNIYVTAALIDSYAKAGSLYSAHRVFLMNSTRSVIVWTSIISAYAAHGDADTAVALFTDMITGGILPDSVTLTAVLTACAHTGLVEEARRIFDSMYHKYNLAPTVENYASMVAVLCRGGFLQEAVHLISSMPMKPNAKAWGALLSGASVFGDVEVGRVAFDHLISIEPDSTGNYIIMANIYSRDGKWDEAEVVREKMRKVGLAKVPGCSWLESSTGLLAFLSRDISSCSEELYAMLDSLVGVIREEGTVMQEEEFAT